MKFKSALVTQVSGSIGGMTGSHNSSGLYFRGRSIPVNPQSAAQTLVRNALAALAPRWSNTLTSTQRAQWNDYAAVVKYTNALGSEVFLSGINWYIATNTLRVQQLGTSAIGSFDTAPPLLSRATLSTPLITSVTATTGITIVTFTNTDLWASALTGALMMWGSRPVAPGVNFFKGPFRYVGRVAGATTPPTSPQNMAAWPFPLTAGQKLFGYFRAVNPVTDQRFSSPVPFSIVAV